MESPSRRRPLAISFRFTVILCALSSLALAQAPAPPTPAPAKPTAPSPASPNPAPLATPIPATAPDATPTDSGTATESAASHPATPDLTGVPCYPACRTGFVCHQGQCVSVCNPPCDEDQVCTAAAVCELKPKSPPPDLRLAPSPHPNLEPRPGHRPHYHDGFYLQLALGGGPALARIKDFEGDDRARLTGALGNFRLALGSTVAPGLAVGGTLLIAQTDETDLKLNGTEYEGGEVSFGLLAAIADWYLDPTNGFHLQAGIGIATLGLDETRDSRIRQDYRGGGLGALLGVGYDLFVSDEWSLGALLGYQFAVVEIEEDEGTDTFRVQYHLPAISFTATLH